MAQTLVHERILRRFKILDIEPPFVDNASLKTLELINGDIDIHR